MGDITKGRTWVSGEVVTADRLNDHVDDATINSNAVVTSKIADGAVTLAKLAADAAVSFASSTEVGGTHTTGTVSSGSPTMTVASATGIIAGMYIVGEGIPVGTTVGSIVTTTVTMSANAATTLSSDPVSFFSATKALSPGNAAGGLCRAWVNFNGQGTVSIRSAFNVSSITDNGIGDYTINFATAMPDANYSTIATCTQNVLTNPAPFSIGIRDYNGIALYSTTQARLTVMGSPGSGLDVEVVCVAFFR